MGKINIQLIKNSLGYILESDEKIVLYSSDKHTSTSRFTLQNFSRNLGCINRLQVYDTGSLAISYGCSIACRILFSIERSYPMAHLCVSFTGAPNIPKKTNSRYIGSYL